MKRKSKFQRESERREAVYQRVADIYAGAMGESCPDIDLWCADLDAIGRAMQAVQARFGLPNDHWIFKPWELGAWFSVETLTDKIIENDLDRQAKDKAE